MKNRKNSVGNVTRPQKRPIERKTGKKHSAIDTKPGDISQKCGSPTKTSDIHRKKPEQISRKCDSSTKTSDTEKNRKKSVGY